MSTKGRDAHDKKVEISKQIDVELPSGLHHSAIIVSVFIFHQSAKGLEESSQEFASLYTSQIKSSLNEFIKEYDKITKSVLVENELIYRLGEGSSIPMNEEVNQRVAVQQLLMRVTLLKSEIGTVMLISRDTARDVGTSVVI
ncbi:hypothetical protein [Paenibacillus illinoisensis]|uniref:hypothetical protein n=1 Tax=Paenibacillus illinoisensis TaxID=59845 RepID=UPI000FDB827D|nr:hypothetical protein [Paenibacillus illinoisensis]